MTIVAQHALQAARDWLDQHATLVDFHVTQQPGTPSAFQAVAIAPHPAGEDITIRRVGNGSTRAHAVDEAWRALVDVAYCTFVDPVGAATIVNRIREGYLFTRDARGEERVRLAVAHRGGEDPMPDAIDGAWLSCKVEGGSDAVTIGDLALRILERQARPITAPAPRRERAGQQRLTA